MTSVRTALTGTPGTGKSTAASRLAQAGVEVCALRTLLREGGGLTTYDSTRETWEVSLSRLSRALPSGDPLVLVGHVAHLLPVGRVVVLRCHPDVLRQRLEERGWTSRKVEENVEAEALGVITGEALERTETYELETTTSSPGDTAAAILDILDGGGATYRAPWVDWSEAILNWY